MSIIEEYVLKIRDTLDKWVERSCVYLLATLIIVVWIGILARYALPWNFTFTEELSRYLMIWVALLSISIGISRRQHVGMLVIFEKLTINLKRFLSIAFGILSILFFMIIFYYSIPYVERGFSQYTMIFGIPRGVPYLIIPIASGMACIQLLLSIAIILLGLDKIPSAGYIKEERKI